MRGVLRPRLRNPLLDRQAGRGPTVRALRIPGDIPVAEREGPLGRVPRHPAILEAVEHERPWAAAQSFIEPTAKIVEHHGSELAVAGVGQPQAAWNVGPRLVPPKLIGGVGFWERRPW